MPENPIHEIKIEDIIQEIVVKAIELESERKAKVEIVIIVLEMIEKIIQKTKNVVVKIETNWRIDVSKNEEYMYAFICYHGECRSIKYRYDHRNGIEAEEVDIEEVARELLLEYNWDLEETLEHIKESIC